jgi:hypothetical protein
MAVMCQYGPVMYGLCMDQLCMATTETGNGLGWFGNLCQFHLLVGYHGIVGYCHDKRTIWYNIQ